MRSPSSSVALVVADVSRERDRLLRTGAAVARLVEYPGFVRVADAIDPDDNRITLVQSLRPNDGNGEQRRG